MTPKTKKFDVVGKIIALESGELSTGDAIELFVHLFNTGQIYHLQGSYGHAGDQLLKSGKIVKLENGQYIAA